MSSYSDPVVTVIPEPVAFGYEYNKMNNVNYFDMFPPIPTPSSSGVSGSGMATLAPTPSMNGLSAASPTYAFSTPYSSTSDSSNASSPDIQSLLPPRHSWPQPSVASGTWYALPTPAPTVDGSAPTSTTSPLTPWPVNVEADNTPPHALAHPHAALLHPHAAARHHPYLAESSLAAHRRALAAMTAGGPQQLQHTHTSPHGAPSNTIAVASLANGGEERPKSGRLGVKRRQKYTRTRTGCLGCRARRIKCDEGRPICRRCTVAKRECVFPDPNEAKKSKKGWSHSDSEEDAEQPHSHCGDVPCVSIDTSIGHLASQPASAPAGMRVSDQSFIAANGSLSEPSSATDLTFDLTQAIPEGYGIGGEPLGWDRAFTGAFDTNNLELDLTAAGVDLTTLTSEDGQGKRSPGESPMLTTPNFLLPWFPTAQEQSLILHYCANAADLMMAIPQGLNPMLAINLPLALESPRGTNLAADALRVTLLGIGAVHQAFLLARSGVDSVYTTATFQYAANLRDMAKMMVRKATTDDPTNGLSDAALSAAASLATIDIFFGGEGWQDNFNIAKGIVAARGGPAHMLKNASPTQIAEDVTVTPVRLILEILTIYESFGCLTLDEEPSLLSGKDAWWFQKSGSAYQDKSVETLFGMSKVMVHLFSRVSRLLARVSKLGHFLDESKCFSDATAAVDTPALAPIDDAKLTAEAGSLKRDIDAWIESLQTPTLEHERVQVGNQAYAHAMKILLMRLVFGRDRSDPDVQASAQQVLQHCSISTAALGMSIDLMWPAVVAGCEVDGSSRQWLVTLLEGFKAQCCFDVETASRIIQEVWRRVDSNAPRADWKSACADLRLKVLLC